MRRIVLSLCCIAITATAAFAADPILPDPKLTPGAVLTADVATICQPGYSRSVRHTSGQLKHQVYAEYGIDRNAGHYEIDHLIPLGIGGADTRENLWPESRDTQPWNAAGNDRQENFLHVDVCTGHMAAQDAQKAIAVDCIAAYRAYLAELLIGRDAGMCERNCYLPVKVFNLVYQSSLTIVGSISYTR